MLSNGKPSNFLELVTYLSLSPYVRCVPPQVNKVERDLKFNAAEMAEDKHVTVMVFQNYKGFEHVSFKSNNKDVWFFQNRFELRTGHVMDPREIYYYLKEQDVDTKAFEGEHVALSTVVSNLIQPTREHRIFADAVATLKEERLYQELDNPDLMAAIQLDVEVPDTGNDQTDITIVKNQIEVCLGVHLIGTKQ